jgi:hypothetical protein
VATDNSARRVYDTSSTSEGSFPSMEPPLLTQNSHVPPCSALSTWPRPTRTFTRALVLLLEELERRDELEGGDTHSRPLSFESQFAQVGWIGLRHLPERGSSVWAELQDEAGSVARVRHTPQNTQLLGRHHPGRASWMSLEVPRRTATTRAGGARRGQSVGARCILDGRLGAGQLWALRLGC